MKILLINTFDKKGGAARATGRLFGGLVNAGEEVRMLVQEKTSGNERVVKTGGLFGGRLNAIRPYIDFAIPLPMIRQRILFSTGLLPDDLIRSIDSLDPDVVHLNWIAGGMVRIESLAKIEQPIVFTLHDLWPLTGGCHSPLDCERYLENCGCCPLLHSNRENDLSRKVYERKKAVYGRIKNLQIVTPSRWLADCVRKSSLLGGRPVTVIPNGLDTDLYRPAGKYAARDHFGLPADRKIILFGGIRGVEYPLKGFRILLEALEKIKTPNVELAVFGSARPKDAGSYPVRSHFFGPVSDEKELALLYAAADLMAVPSYQEVFGQTASEALSCGIPVTAFAVTGLLDIVDHLETGYLARPFYSSDFAAGIDWILSDPVRHEQLSARARAETAARFDIGRVAGLYMGIYRKAAGMKT